MWAVTRIYMWALINQNKRMHIIKSGLCEHVATLSLYTALVVVYCCVTSVLVQWHVTVCVKKSTLKFSRITCILVIIFSGKIFTNGLDRHKL